MRGLGCVNLASLVFAGRLKPGTLRFRSSGYALNVGTAAATVAACLALLVWFGLFFLVPF